MDIITIDMVKQHCRIDWYDPDPEKQRKIDETIKKCANLAEGMVYNHIGKGYFTIMKEYGEIPLAIRHAVLMAASDMILGRLSTEDNEAFKALLKPYKKKEQ